MTKHTPGPWTASKPFTDGRVRINHNDGHGFILVGEVDLRDASLIAAAPEMLEALKECYPLLGAAHLRHALEAVRAAIAKAETGA